MSKVMIEVGHPTPGFVYWVRWDARRLGERAVLDEGWAMFIRDGVWVLVGAHADPNAPPEFLPGPVVHVDRIDPGHARSLWVAFLPTPGVW